MAPSSALLVINSSRRIWIGSPLSQGQPPKESDDIMTTGTLSVIRSSRAAMTMVCVPPPEAPVTPTRVVSTHGWAHR